MDDYNSGLSSKEIKKTREPIVEGIFYPEAEDELKKKIENLLAESKVIPGNNFAIISPHAGLQYAGSIMAAAFKAVAHRDIETVVILAPTHRETTEAIAFPESHYFRTPLGSITVNQKLVEELLSCSTLFLRNDIPHLEEHCIEVLLPFVQVLYPKAQLIPILLNQKKFKSIKVLANALQLIFSGSYDKVLFVASSNASFSFKKETGEKEADRFLELVLKQKGKELLGKELLGKQLLSGLEKKEITACGTNAVATLLSFKDAQYAIKVLERGHSHQVNPSSSSIVHYAAVSIALEARI